jgi:hypothetical protein
VDVQTLEQEKIWVYGIFEEINDYVQKQDWSKRGRVYEPQLDVISKIITDHGILFEEYGVSLYGANDLPVLIIVQIAGKVNPAKPWWKLRIELVNQPQPKEDKGKDGPPEYIPWGFFDPKQFKYWI